MLGAGGLIAGRYGGPLLVFAVFAPTLWLERRRTRHVYRRHFGDYRDASRRSDWEALKSKLQVGDMHSGRVVEVLDHDRVIDLGLGFPARLPGYASIAKTRLEISNEGTQVAAAVRCFDERERLIELRQTLLTRVSSTATDPTAAMHS